MTTSARKDDSFLQAFGPAIETVLASPHPAARYKVRRLVLGESPRSKGLRGLRDEVKASAVVQTLLAGVRAAQSEDQQGWDVYAKWHGVHWLAAALADVGYPPGDRSLCPMRDRLLDAWLRPNFLLEFSATRKAQAYGRPGVPIMQGRHRRCASQQANALWSILRLGLENKRTHELAERLLHWQWPDGGWNCDKHPDAKHSSFMETILPLRALALYATRTGDASAWAAADRAKEVFLTRNMYLGRRSGAPINRDFTELHYPLYWHYDVLHGLKVMAESGYIDDPRCTAAIELLLSRQLPGGGWAATKKYYRSSAARSNGNDAVDWGPTGRTRANPWITADALYVLRAAGVDAP